MTWWLISILGSLIWQGHNLAAITCSCTFTSWKPLLNFVIDCSRQPTPSDSCPKTTATSALHRACLQKPDTLKLTSWVSFSWLKGGGECPFFPKLSCILTISGVELNPLIPALLHCSSQFKQGDGFPWNLHNIMYVCNTAEREVQHSEAICWPNASQMILYFLDNMMWKVKNRVCL